MSAVNQLSIFWSKVFASRKTLTEFSGVKKTGGFLAREKAGWVRFTVVALLIVACVGGASAESFFWESSENPSAEDVGQGIRGVEFKTEISNPVIKNIELTDAAEDSNSQIIVYDVDTGNKLRQENLDNFDPFTFDTPVSLNKGNKFRIVLDGTYEYIQKQFPINYDGLTVYGGRFLCNSDGSGCNSLDGYYYSIRGIEIENSNEKPQFNFTSISPDPPLIGENVSYSAEVSDSDGSIDYTNLTLEYGGSTVVVDAQRVGSTSPEWNDIYTPQSGNKWLNATLETVDDAGATTTTEINRFLSDDAPSVTLNDPGNQTYFKYGVPLSVSVSDSDSEPGESWSCSVDKDNTQVDSFNLKEGTNSRYSSTVQSDLGTHTVNVSCSDGSGNTGSVSKSYSVKAYELQSVYGADPVYETENRTFDADLKTGSMVNSVDFSVNYDGSVVDTQSLSSTGVETLRPDLHHEVPLVDSNQTSKNWDISFDVNKTDYQSSSTSILSDSSSSQSQEVLWSYYLEKSDTDPTDGDYIEGDDLKHNLTLHTETSKADITGQTTYNRTGETSSMNVISNTTDERVYQGSIGVGNAEDFNRTGFEVESSLDLSFNSESRSIGSGKDSVYVHRIRLSDDSSETDTAEALVFDTDYEGSQGQDIETDLFMDITVSKNGIDRRYSYISEGETEHSFYIRPSWAQYDLRTTEDDLIQYEKSDGNGVLRSYFFPQRETISNEPTTVPLLNINRTETTRIDFEVTESSGSPAAQVICRVDRKFPGLGKYQTVFMIQTGSEGNTESFAEINEIYYRFTCYEDGEVIDEIPDTIMENPMRLQLGVEDRQTTLDYNQQFDASCTNNQTQLECNYQSSSDKLKQAVLEVERRETVKNMEVCTKTGQSRTGVLVCDGLNTTENTYEYEITGYYPENGQSS